MKRRKGEGWLYVLVVTVMLGAFYSGVKAEEMEQKGWGFEFHGYIESQEE